MRYNLESLLPINAFQPRGRSPFAYGMTLEGGGGGGFNPIQAISDAVSGVGDALASIDPGPAIGDVGASIDKGVNDVIPGGWMMVGAIALTVATMGTVDLEGEVLAAEAAAEAAEAGAVAAESGAVASEAGALASGVEAGTTAGELAAEEAAKFSGQELMKQAGVGALKGAGMNALGQVIQTGNIDPSKVAIGGLTGAVMGGLGNTLSQYGANPLLSGALAGTAGGALNASLNGGDIGRGMLVGGIGGTVGGATNMAGQSLGLDPLTQGALSGAASGMTSAALNNKSIGAGALSGAVVGGASALGNQVGNFAQNSATGDTGNTLLGQVLGGAAGFEAKDLLNPTSTPPQRTVLAGAPRATQQTGVLPRAGASALPQNPSQVAGFMPTFSPSGAPIYGNANSSSGLAGATGLPSMASTTSNNADLSLPGGVAGVPLASSPNANTGYTSNLFPSSGLNASGMPAQLQAGIMQSEIPQDVSPQQLAQLQQLNPNLLNQLTRNMPVMAKNGGHIRGYAGGGLLDFPASAYDKTTALFAPMAEPRNSKVPYGNPTGSHWRSLDRTHFVNGMANGGEPEHIPEFITGETGHYVKGRGDGQSDDIPAMLADGEYVFDADTVAQLGNGSSDAGAKLLDHFRESLREHKRSAPSDKIPHKANPLAYMKEALKRHKG